MKLEAMKKERVELNAIVLCPECHEKSEVHFSRRNANVTIECPECGKVRDEIVSFGGGAIVGDLDD